MSCSRARNKHKQPDGGVCYVHYFVPCDLMTGSLTVQRTEGGWDISSNMFNHSYLIFFVFQDGFV